MFEITREEFEWGGRTLTLETGRIARQADGAVLATYGETSVLATVVADRSPKPGLDFFPLTVNYQEKAYAAGKVPGGYFKREGRPSEKETLVSRLIDRPIRPLFVKGFKNETQVIATVVSHDLENDADIVALVAVSAALTISGVPFQGPIGGARVGFINGEYVLNPTIEQMEETSLDLVVAGTQDAVLMVESEADELSEDVMLGAVMFGHKEFQPVIDACIRMAEKAAKEPRDVPENDDSELKAKVAGIAEDGLKAAYQEADKQTRQEKVAELRDAVNAELVAEDASPDERIAVSGAFKGLESDIVRGGILDTEKRIDGRGLADVRPIVSEVGVLPRTHGSSLFTRGETQALVVATLGTGAPVPKVATTSACVSPRVNRLEPWVRGNTPTSETIGRTSARPRPSMRFSVSRIPPRTISLSRPLNAPETAMRSSGLASSATNSALTASRSSATFS